MKKAGLKKGDFIVAAGVLLLSFLLILLLRVLPNAKEGKTVFAVYGDNKISSSLSEDAEFEIKNNDITLKVRIENGQAYVTYADCPDKICVNTGRISRAGERIICMPAGVCIYITGGEDEIIVAG